MDLAITRGALSYVDPGATSAWYDFECLLEKLAPHWELISIQPERQELLLQARNGASWNPEEIHEILYKLQQRTQRSFVALLNSAKQYALITVRG
ncbi:MAG: hypothetical protein ACFFDI_24115 [Promethearchaeota archaeon]